MSPKTPKSTKPRRSTVGRDPLDALDVLIPGKPGRKAATPAKKTEPEPPARVRATFHLSEGLLDEARGATLSTALELRYTVSGFVEDAIREKLERLRKSHNAGKPFPLVGAGDGIPTGRPQAGRRRAASA